MTDHEKRAGRPGEGGQSNNGQLGGDDSTIIHTPSDSVTANQSDAVSLDAWRSRLLCMSCDLFGSIPGCNECAGCSRMGGDSTWSPRPDDGGAV